MVDFDNETTVGTPAVDIVRVLWLQARAYLLEAWEDYTKKSEQGVESGLHIIKARVFTLWMEMQGYLKRALKPEQYDEKRLLLDSDEPSDLLALTEFLNEHFDVLRITRIDTKIMYNRQSIETENIHHGL